MKLDLRQKLIRTAIAVVLDIEVTNILRPIASLASNSVIVNQLQHSDVAALAMTYTANGEWIPALAINVVTILALVFIWTRKDSK